MARWDYSTPGSGGYSVPNIVYDDPSSRKMKVITVGSGFSGITMAYHIQQLCENVEHVIYDKERDVGGVWTKNKYPGVACDFPSHSYTLNFALNPEWPKCFSSGADINEYQRKVVQILDLRKYMVFETEVIRSEWHDDSGKWKITLRQTTKSGEIREIEEECDLFVLATGLLDNYKYPDIPGLNNFEGRILHTARWPQDYQKEQWANDRVAVLGTGASSIQVVPSIQPYVKHLDIFARTPVWFFDISTSDDPSKEYTEEEKEIFRRNPRAILAHAKNIENAINSMFGVFYKGSEIQEGAKQQLTALLKEKIRDPRLAEGFIPKFDIGCRRVTPGDPYIEAIQKDNVDVHFMAAQSLTQTGIIGTDGIERKVDTVICATGFDVSYVPRFPILGKGGVDLRDKWRKSPEAYLGIACPDMPNLVMFGGPTWPNENGTVLGAYEAVARYIIQIIKKMQCDHIKSFVPRQDVTDLFNEHAQEWHKHMIWKDDCRAWYKDNETGRINAIWCGSSIQYTHVIRSPRFEDFEITYQHKNLWAHLGMGFSIVDIKKEDLSPYLRLNAIDPRWLKAVGCEEPIKAEPDQQELDEIAKVACTNFSTLST